MSSLPIRLTVAKDLPQAAGFLNSTNYDLVVLDVIFSDSLHHFLQLHLIPDTAKILILVNDENRKDGIDPAIESQIAFLPKPFSPDDLIDLVSELLSLQQSSE